MGQVAHASTTPEMVNEVLEWLEQQHNDQLDRMAEAYDAEADESLRGESIRLCLTELREVESDLYDIIRQPFDQGGGNVEAGAAEAVIAALEDRVDGEVERAERDGWNIEWVDPPEEMIVSPGDSLAHRAGELVAFHGRVRRATKPKPRPVQVKFQCRHCMQILNHPLRQSPDSIVRGEFYSPKKCDDEGCLGSSFTALQQHEETVTRHYQYFQVEEELSGSSRPTPADINVYAFRSCLIGDYREGESVTITGRIRLRMDDSDSGMWIEAVSIEGEDTGHTVEVDEEDEEYIEDLVRETDDPLNLFTASFAPHIHGREEAKRGIALALVGTGEDFDGLIHVAEIGDPGTGKTDLLEEASSIAPHSKCASMSSATKAGLTASAIQESVGGSKEWMLSLGPLPLANGGVLTIDEMDNSNFALSDLNDPLDQGYIKVSKSKFDTRVDTEARVLAAANPEDSSFDPLEPLNDQLGFDADILSRFDLVYPFEDDPEDEEMNEGIANEMARKYLPEDKIEESVKPDLQTDTLRMWVKMADEYSPEYTREATDEIAQKWQALRLGGTEAVTLDVRSQEAAYRLARAHARLRLSDRVEREDALVALRTVREMEMMWGNDIKGEGWEPPATDEEETDEVDPGTELNGQHYEQVKNMAREADMTANEVVETALPDDHTDAERRAAEKLVEDIRAEGVAASLAGGEA